MPTNEGIEIDIRHSRKLANIVIAMSEEKSDIIRSTWFAYHGREAGEMLLSLAQTLEDINGGV
jgi:hypothetical protein